MISDVRLPRSGLKTTRLAFGTSRLHYMASNERQRLLATAVDLGIKHFDTAPVYGDTLAELEMGRFVRGRRAEVVIATKYGIAPDPVLAAMPALGTPLRAARSVVRKLGFWQMRQPPMTADALRDSTEQSLRRLGTDVIDILFLHEPVASRIPSLDDLLAELANLQQRGLVRHAGLSGSWSGISSLGKAARAAVSVLQTAEADWPDGEPPDITYSVLSEGPQSAFGKRREPAEIRDRLRSALARRPDGTVLVSTTRAEHVRDLVRFTEERA